MDMTAIVSPILFRSPKRSHMLARNGVSLVGIVTHSGTLYARPGQDIALFQSGGIIP